MTDAVIRVPSVKLPSPDTVVPVSMPTEPKAAPAAQQDSPSLAIEKGATGYVYKVLDRKTGDVIRQIPHKSLADMAKDPDYDAGRVIITSA